MADIDFIRDLAVVMLVAGVAGWIFQRIGLSVVVGYLLAGIVIGPFTPPFPLVQDTDRIQILANVGLIFLLFSIGMGLSVQRLRRLGLPVLIGTMLAALMMFAGWRFIGQLVGLSGIQSLFLAGMLVCSSSAIIGKILQETGASHRKFGQLALGVTVMEDMVAIIVLTILVSYVGVGDTGSPTVWHALGLFIAFVVFVGVLALFLLPRLLGFLSRRAATEIQTLVVGAILMILALSAHGAGYSLALGAFLMGVIVAETAQRAQVERTFEGLRHIFSAVFFVAIGMLIDLSLVADVWIWIVLLSAGTIFTRSAAIGVAMLLMGNTTRDSVRTGLAVTPLGEFSFIIAQAGIAAAVLPDSFYPLAVGASLLTALAGTVLLKNSDRIADWVVKVEPQPVRRYLELYEKAFERLSLIDRENHFWRRSRKELITVALGIFFLVGLLVPAQPLFGRVVEAVGRSLLFPNGTAVLFWGGLIVLLLFPLTIVWRNISRFAATVREVLQGSREGANYFPFVVAAAIQGIGAMILAILLATLLPLGAVGFGVILFVLLLGGVVVFLLRHRFSDAHQRFEAEIEATLAPSPKEEPKELPNALKSPEEWNLDVKEAVIPDFADCAGKTLQELDLRRRSGASIVAIERHGYMIANPGPTRALFPGDRVLLVGNNAQLRAVREVLEATTGAKVNDIAEVGMETVTVPEGTPHAEKTLLELETFRKTGVQIAGVKRKAMGELIPGGATQIQTGDKLLVLGTPDQVRSFRHWLATGTNGDEE